MLSPFWDDPANEAPRLARVHDPTHEAFGSSLAFYLAKSHNDNVLGFTQEGPDEPVRIRWVELDRGTGDVQDLNIFERNLLVGDNGWDGDTAYVVRIPVLEQLGERLGRDLSVRVSWDMASQRPVGFIQLRPDPDAPPRPCRVDYGYMQCLTGLRMGLEYICIYGTDMDGNPVEERLVVNETTG